MFFFVLKSTTTQQPITKPEVQIVNLSIRKLDETETKLLEKGLKFTPVSQNSNT